jgi:hypothetical protein
MRGQSFPSTEAALAQTGQDRKGSLWRSARRCANALQRRDGEQTTRVQPGFTAVARVI